MRTKKTKKKQQLFDVFVGSFVNILTKHLRGTQVDINGSRINGNVIIQGILLDECETYYYLSGNGEAEVTDAVLKTDVVRMYTEAGEMNNMMNLESETGVRQ